MKKLKYTVLFLFLINCKYHDPSFFEDTYIQENADRSNKIFQISDMPKVNEASEESIVKALKVWPSVRMTFTKSIAKNLDGLSFNLDKISAFEFTKEETSSNNGISIWRIIEYTSVICLFEKNILKHYVIRHKKRGASGALERAEYDKFYNMKNIDSDTEYFQNEEEDISCYLALMKEKYETPQKKCPHWSETPAPSGIWEVSWDQFRVLLMRMKYHYFPPLPIPEQQ